VIHRSGLCHRGCGNPTSCRGRVGDLVWVLFEPCGYLSRVAVMKPRTIATSPATSAQLLASHQMFV
jgi:hypothetical protein